MHLLRHLLVVFVSAFYHYETWAIAFRGIYRHGGMYPKTPRLITCSGQHASWAIMPHGHGYASQLFMVTLFNRSEKGIHVNVDDLSLLRHCFRRRHHRPRSFHRCQTISTTWHELFPLPTLAHRPKLSSPRIATRRGHRSILLLEWHQG